MAMDREWKPTSEEVDALAGAIADCIKIDIENDGGVSKKTGLTVADVIKTWIACGKKKSVVNDPQAQG